MNQKSLPDRPIRRTIDFDDTIYEEICAVALEKKWSVSYTCYVLLQQAIKERNRKKSPKNKAV